MKIAICGSMAFANEMADTKKSLEELSHRVELPKGIEYFLIGTATEETKWEKIEFDSFKHYYGIICNSDAILVLNYDKHGIQNYIGGNSLMEMGFAYVNNKKIFLMNQIPKLSYTEEIEAMKPIIIFRNMTKII